MVEPALQYLTEFLQSLQLIKVVFGCFLLFIFIQLIAAFRCLYLIINMGAHKDIKAFMNDYWRWSHLHQNSLILSLWLSSFTAYFSVWLVTSKLSDIAIADAYVKMPIQTSVVLTGLISLGLYTLLRSRDQVAKTRKSIIHLKRMRRYGAFRSALKRVQSAPINATSWGAWIGTLATATEWISEHFVKRSVDARMKNALVNFGVYAAFEYLIRMSIVALAVWITYS